MNSIQLRLIVAIVGFVLITLTFTIYSWTLSSNAPIPIQKFEWRLHNLASDLKITDGELEQQSQSQIDALFAGYEDIWLGLFDGSGEPIFTSANTNNELSKTLIELAKVNALYKFKKVGLTHTNFLFTVADENSLSVNFVNNVPAYFFIVKSANTPIALFTESDSSSEFFEIALNLLASDTILPILIGLPFVIFLISHIAISPLQRAAKIANSIEPSNLSLRLPLTKMPTEIIPLVEAMNKALQRIDEGYQSLGKFTSAAAHELKTPLAFINIYLSELPDFESKQKVLLSTNRLNMIVEQILSLSLIRQHRVEYESFDLVLLAREVVADRAPFINDSNIDIVFNNSVDKKMVNGVKMAIFSAIANLIDNAVEHAKETPLIEVYVNDKGIGVVDYGPGISDSFKESAFKPHSKEKSASSGHGLGLAIVKEIMNVHHGEVSVVKNKEKGATFFLSFPTI